MVSLSALAGTLDELKKSINEAEVEREFSRELQARQKYAMEYIDEVRKMKRTKKGGGDVTDEGSDIFESGKKRSKKRKQRTWGVTQTSTQARRSLSM